MSAMKWSRALLRVIGATSLGLAAASASTGCSGIVKAGTDGDGDASTLIPNDAAHGTSPEEDAHLDRDGGGVTSDAGGGSVTTNTDGGGVTTNTDGGGVTTNADGGRVTTDGSTGDRGEIGDPCFDDAGCGKGYCNGAWCQTACASSSDTSCGNPAFDSGVPNVCVGLGIAGFFCFPGCQTNLDCTRYEGTTCQPVLGQGVYVCSSTTGSLGDPCGAGWTPCDADEGYECNGDWCTVMCSSPTDNMCGTSSSGLLNSCAAATDGGPGGYWCTPGCTSDFDCTPYAATVCHSIDGGGDGGGFCGQ